MNRLSVTIANAYVHHCRVIAASISSTRSRRRSTKDYAVSSLAFREACSKLQYYHGNPDMSCTQNPVAGLPWCPVIWGDYILRIQATISTISRVVDQVCALKCTVAGSNPSMRPVRYREVRSIPLKYVCNFIFDHFL